MKASGPLPSCRMHAAPGRRLPLAALLLCLFLQQPGSNKAWKQHTPRLRLTYKGKGAAQEDFLGVCALLGRAGRASCRQGAKGAARAWRRPAAAPPLWLQHLHTLGPWDVPWLQPQAQPLRMLH